MDKLKSVAKRFWYVLKSQSFSKLSDAPYATHIPVFIGISTMSKFEQVLEFGSGVNSTLAFMNRDIFPSIKRIVSYENDLGWYNKIKEQTCHDERVNLNFYDGKISNSVSAEDIGEFDLVFVDDSGNSKDRASTIRAVISRNPKMLIIHDFEVPAYRLATRPFRSTYRFKALLPNTGVCTNTLSHAQLDSINSVIMNNKNMLAPDDVYGWLRKFTNGDI